jgi:hypothetical protein
MNELDTWVSSLPVAEIHGVPKPYSATNNVFSSENWNDLSQLFRNNLNPIQIIYLCKTLLQL